MIFFECHFLALPLLSNILATMCLLGSTLNHFTKNISIFMLAESEGEEEVVDVDVPPSESFVFEDIRDIASLPDGCYCRLKSKVFESADFLRQPNDIGLVWQKTVLCSLILHRIQALIELILPYTC